ncbi:MAG: PIN domain-containing protein [Euryarchaeota archaeon]|nr:PIN domain-containing protein [Euryarchaeota archaeon]MBV1756187.1 PIN domain-containing protein [Methanobacterium sp.]MBV1768420.1 PIN domain-containing protein [Methanobacterium sp.]
MIYVDSSFFIALALKNDQWHEKALKLIPKIENSEKMVSNLIISESVTLVGSLGGGKNGKMIYNYIADNCHITHIDQDICDSAIETFLKYDGVLSFADSVSIELMNIFKINKIVSFDSDFDKVKEIERIH